MGQIQFVTVDEETGSRLRIELDPEGLAALRKTIAALPTEHAVGTSRMLDGADVWLDGILLPTALTVVERVSPVRRKFLRKDVIIAGAIMLTCIGLILAAFIMSSAKPALPSEQPKPASAP